MVRSINQTLQIIEYRRKSRDTEGTFNAFNYLYIYQINHASWMSEENHISDYRNCRIASIESQCLI